MALLADYASDSSEQADLEESGRATASLALEKGSSESQVLLAF